jgi:hypothetical protein
MAQTKQKFDPLSGQISDGLRKNKSKGKSFDVLGGSFGREHSMEKNSRLTAPQMHFSWTHPIH